MKKNKKETAIEELRWVGSEAAKLSKSEEKQEADDFIEAFAKIFNKNDAVKLLVEPASGDIVDANKTACDFYGYVYEELISKKITEINKLNEKEVIEEYHKQKTEGRDYFINKQQLASGDIKKVEIRSVSVLKGDKKYFFFLIHPLEKKHSKSIHLDLYHEMNEETPENLLDNNKLMISEGLELIEKNARDLILLTSKLAESERKLKELNVSKDRFFSIISHDIKNSFASILGLSRLLTKPEHTNDPEKRQTTAQKLHDSSKKLYALLENLLEWAKLQRNEIIFSPEKINVKEICEEVVDLLSLKALDKEIELTFGVDDSLEVFSDHNMIKTVLRNLVTNAINFTEAGGRVTITAEESDSFVNIKVDDTGVGISEDNLQKLFRIESKFIGENTEGGRGSGLGLILVREFIEKNRGKIRVDSEIGKGSTFTIALPKESSSDIIIDANGKIL